MYGVKRCPLWKLVLFPFLYEFSSRVRATTMCRMGLCRRSLFFRGERHVYVLVASLKFLSRKQKGRGRAGVRNTLTNPRDWGHQGSWGNTVTKYVTYCLSVVCFTDVTLEIPQESLRNPPTMLQGPSLNDLSGLYTPLILSSYRQLS